MSRLLMCITVSAIGIITAMILKNDDSKDTTDYSKSPPWFLFNGVMMLIRFLTDTIEWLEPPALHVLKMGFGINGLAAAYACSKAGWPELLASGPKSVTQLAAHANMSDKMANRLLRTCASFKVFRDVSTKKSALFQDRMYQNRPYGDILRNEHPHSVKHLLHMQIEDISPAMLKLWDSMRNDSLIPFSLAHNLPHTSDAMWVYYESNPKQAVQFNQAMTNTNLIGLSALLLDFPWRTKCNAVVDIGGGKGSFLAALLRSAPNSKGVLFDRAEVIEEAKTLWSAQYVDVLDRAQFIGGTFMNANDIPKPAADSGTACFVTKSILHDWDDASATKIVNNVAAVMRPGDLFLVLEMIQRDDEEDPIRSLMDMQMRMYRGSERTEGELRHMMKQADLETIAVHDTRSINRILESVRVAATDANPAATDQKFGASLDSELLPRLGVLGA